VVVNYKPSILGNGVTRVWVNGELVFSISGVTNAHYDDLGPTLKFGYYQTSASPTTIYWDEIRIGEDVTYEDVAPGGSSPPAPDEPEQTTRSGRITTGHGRIGAGYGRIQ